MHSIIANIYACDFEYNAILRLFIGILRMTIGVKLIPNKTYSFNSWLMLYCASDPSALSRVANLFHKFVNFFVFLMSFSVVDYDYPKSWNFNNRMITGYQQYLAQRDTKLPILTAKRGTKSVQKSRLRGNH